VAGTAATPDRKSLTAKPIVNGTKGQVVDNAATLRTDLVPWAWRGNVGLTHVEGHVAAMMRERGGPREVILVGTREPCPDKFGCDATLRSMLPRGGVLHVYVRDGNGHTTYFDTYVGTGEGAKNDEV
jgi:hypothetical protein